MGHVLGDVKVWRRRLIHPLTLCTATARLVFVVHSVDMYRAPTAFRTRNAAVYEDTVVGTGNVIIQGPVTTLRSLYLLRYLRDCCTPVYAFCFLCHMLDVF
jgi:hypothetical protein